MKTIFSSQLFLVESVAPIRHLSQKKAKKTSYQFFKVYDMIRTISRYFTGKKVF